MNTAFSDLIPSAGAVPSAPRRNVFFGLLPPQDVACRTHRLAADLSRSARVSGVVRPAHVLHVSLMLVARELGEAPPSPLTEGLRTRAEMVRQRPFTVSLNRIEAWGRTADSGPVVALGDEGVFGVEALHRALAEVFGRAEHPGFNPHMTLLYGRGPAIPVPIPPITWAVREFALIHSLVGLTRYEVLARFPLSV